MRRRSPAPVQDGIAYATDHRAPGGKELESGVEVVEYAPDRVFALDVKEGTPIHAPAHRAARRPHAPQAATEQVATLKRVLERTPAAA